MTTNHSHSKPKSLKSSISLFPFFYPKTHGWKLCTNTNDQSSSSPSSHRQPVHLHLHHPRVPWHWSNFNFYPYTRVKELERFHNKKQRDREPWKTYGREPKAWQWKQQGDPFVEFFLQITMSKREKLKHIKRKKNFIFVTGVPGYSPLYSSHGKRKTKIWIYGVSG